MYTLIPEQSAKYLKKEYRIRVSILALLFMSFGVWVGIVTLFPSYIVSVTQEKRVISEAAQFVQNSHSASTTMAVVQIAAVNTAITTLQNSQDSLALSSIVEDIAGRQVPGISITDFEIGRTGGTGTNILIQGRAATRQDLVSFENNLKADVRFSKVYLPVSDLAADTNIPFSFSLTGTE